MAALCRALPTHRGHQLINVHESVNQRWSHAIEEDFAEGRAVHLAALQCWRSGSLDECETLNEWAGMLMRLEGAHESKSKGVQQLLEDAMGAYPALGVALDNRLLQGTISVLA